MAHSRQNANYRQNHGVKGVVYILDNPGLREGLYKIGCSRNSGSKRANDLNNNANTGTPGTFRCIFECHTKNCGKAEEWVFKKLSNHRQGKRGQEFFSIDLEIAKATIIAVCKEIDEEVDRDPPPAKPMTSSTPINISPLPSNPQPTSGQPIPKISKPVVNVIFLIFVCVLIVRWGSSNHHRSVAEPQPSASLSYGAPVPVQHRSVPLEETKPVAEPFQQAAEDSTSTNSLVGTPRHQFLAGKEVDYPLHEKTSEENQGDTYEPSPAPEPKLQMTRVEVRNLNLCLDGRYKTLCKHNLLTAEQATQVADAERSANLKSCLDGRYPSLCDHQSLTNNESIDVDLAERRANFKSCIDGRYPALCNHERLSDSEAASVKEAEARENLKVCMDGRYPALCNHSLLTSEQSVKVRINEEVSR